MTIFVDMVEYHNRGCSMNKKFAYHAEDIELYIINRIKAGAKKEQIILEVFSDFAPETIFYKCDIDMIEAFIGEIYRVAYMLINNTNPERS